jgi:UDP-glucose 4-epimerase
MTGTTTPLTWIIGQGGLLGSALLRQGNADVFQATPIPWSDHTATQLALQRNVQEFKNHANTRPWRITWAAGHATVSSSAHQTQQEVIYLNTVTEALKAHAPSGPGHFLLTSSAGGVYAGSDDPPFTSNSTPNPLTAYGRAKLEQEAIARQTLADTCPVTIARVSNLYGPGQRLDKLQGVTSRLCLAAITHDPINLFVPLSTVRDYIDVDDAATILGIWANTPGDRTVLVASGIGTSLGQLLRITQDVTHRKVPVAMGSHPSAAGQAHDLRFIPTPIPRPQSLPQPTPLTVGVKRVFDDILQQRQAGAA